MTHFFKSIFVSALSILFAGNITAKEQTDAFPYLFATYALQIPGGDLAKQFGMSSEIGGGVGYKTAGDFTFSIECTYIFGNDVKDNTLENILNSEGELTNMYGEPALITMRQSGIQTKISAGKIFTFKKNSSSGILLRISGGFLQHKININNPGNNTPQIAGDYKKGYDRLTAGCSLSEFVGWQNFSKNSAFNFLVGFEFTQAFTKNMRTWDYATNSSLSGRRNDYLYSLKIAWFIPLRKQSADEYFYY